MRRKALVALIAVALLVLAGCSGGPNAQSNETTTAPAGTTNGPGNETGGTTTPAGEQISPSEADLPPGVTPDGIENRSALLAAHRRGLSDTGFVLTTRTNLSLGGNESQRLGSRSRVTAEQGLSSFLVTSNSTTAFGTQTADIWGNDSVGLTRVRMGNQTRYRPLPAGTNRTDLVTRSQQLRTYFGMGEYTVSGVERRDGRTFVTLTADEYTQPENGTGIGAENVSSFRSEAVVDSSGVVHSFDLRVNATTGQGNVTIDLGYALERTGDVTVERPSWVPEAMAQVTIADVSANLTDGYLTLTHEGGDTIPSGATVLVHAGGQQHVVRTASDFEAGQSRYVSVTADGNASISTTEPSGDVQALEPPVNVQIISDQTRVVNVTVTDDGE